ncbi:F-box/FBD/LRR-repeat protein At2g26030-like [Tasmannia lanceolata]|uniref:F-box/FBD/LRR-repeat protein At2g26030-like n=1 Tax=Tasmannia lanceolata TaxID=3420 RepID=UPI0040633CC0
MRATSKFKRKMQPRMGKREEEEEEQQICDDRISYLSDDILIMILSRIPLREAVKTCVLSKRWTYLWCSIPYLDLDRNLMIGPTHMSRESDEKDEIGKWVSIVHHILDSRRTPIMSCRIFIEYSEEFTDNFNEIVLFLCENGIQDLYLEESATPYIDDVFYCYQFPTDAYLCQSLKKLTLFRYKVVLPPLFEGISFLTTLTLIEVFITDVDFERFVSSCQLLESFCLDDNLSEQLELRSLRISALNLMSLEIYSTKPTHISLEAAPRLENLFYSPNAFSNDSEAGMFVELLMNLGHVESLKLKLFPDTQPLCRMIPTSLPALNLKKLTLDVDYDVVLFLPCLLRSCPNLQELNIIITKVPWITNVFFYFLCCCI